MKVNLESDILAVDLVETKRAKRLPKKDQKMKDEEDEDDDNDGDDIEKYWLNNWLSKQKQIGRKNFSFFDNFLKVKLKVPIFNVYYAVN